MDKIWKDLKKYEKILILGFGREGKSSYSFIRKYDKEKLIGIADLDEKIKDLEILKNDHKLNLFLGEDYLKSVLDYDLIIKAPGVRIPDEIACQIKGHVTSQVDIFLQNYRDKTIGITGTKGKSTTASFLNYFLKISGVDSILLGNIGIPAFDMLEEIKENTIIVAEFSSYMLRGISVSPHYAILLNIFPEHLNYHGSLEDYALSKANIFKFQKEGDYLALGESGAVKEIYSKIGSKASLVEKNMYSNIGVDRFPEKVIENLELAKSIAILAGAKEEYFIKAVETFPTLPHRQEIFGPYRGITFVDDSISTIPESTILALESFPNTDILFVGGLDRGISQEKLIDKIIENKKLKVFCMDETGKNIFDELSLQGISDRIFFFEDLENAVKEVYEILPNGGFVVLSPGAASYNKYKNFEEKGDAFKNLAKNMEKKLHRGVLCKIKKL